MVKDHYILFKHCQVAADLLTVAAAYGLIRRITAHIPLSAAILEPALVILLIVSGLTLVLGRTPCQAYSRGWRFASMTLLPRWLFVLAATTTALLVRPDWQPNSQTAALLPVAGFAALVGLRALVASVWRSWCRRSSSLKNALIVGTGPLARSIADSVMTQPEQRIRICGFLDIAHRSLWRYRDIPYRGNLAKLQQLVKSEQIDYVLFCLKDWKRAAFQRAVEECTRMGVTALVITDRFAGLPTRRRAVDFAGWPALMLDSAPPLSLPVVAKWSLDRLVAIGIVLLTTPVLLAAAIAVKLSSPGPILFGQVRVGLNGRRFKMWKFRTMVHDAEALKASLLDQNEMSGPVFKIRNDPRVTSVGHWLRRASIDELPQLFNVIKGDMSLVGPRPPLPDEVRQYAAWHRRRLCVKPGLTCLWQVQGRNEIDFEDWMRLDLQYIDNWSMGKDVEIFFKTIPAVIRGAGSR